MRKKTFIPGSYKLFVVWYQNYARKLAEYATLFGFDTATVQQAANDALAAAYGLQIIEIFKHELNERVKFKDMFYDGPLGTVLTIPTMPTLPTAPTVIPIAGLLKRTFNQVKRIKGHPSYTEEIGMDFGIIGAETFFDINTYKPNLKVKNLTGTRKIEFTKGQTDGVNVYCKVTGTDSWMFLARDTVSPYVDNRSFPQPTKLDYMVRGVVNDEEIGLESDTVTIITK